MQQDFHQLIEENLSGLIKEQSLALIHESQTNTGMVREYHCEHLVLVIGMENDQAQLLIGSRMSRKDMWPIPLLLDTIDPQDSLRTLPDFPQQAKDLIDKWGEIYTMMSPESFPTSLQKVQDQIRRCSENMFNFSSLK